MAVSLKLRYTNHTLAAIMRAISAQCGSEHMVESLFNKIKVIEDTPAKWAIHTPEEWYYTVHTEVRDVCADHGVVFKAADTGNPDWDLFCSA